MNRTAEPGRADRILEADLGWLLHSVTRRHADLVDDLLCSPVGGLRGYWVLTIVAQSTHRQKDVGDRLGIDRTVMTYLLDELEVAGLVHRTPDTTDRRAWLIQITDQGRAALYSLADRVIEVDHHLLIGLDGAEQTQLRTLLSRLTSAQGFDHPTGDGNR